MNKRKSKLTGMGGKPKKKRLPNLKGKAYSNPGSHSKQRRGSR